MSSANPSFTSNRLSPERCLPWLLFLFFGSGCAALIYEVVWFQSLELVIGSSAVSLGVLLGTYMGGMCLGSLLFPRLVSAKQHPLRAYALLELGIGAVSFIVLYGLPLTAHVYVALAGGDTASLLLRGLFCAVLLLPPTLMMGATLPAIARWVEATPRGVSWLGFFYGGNIAGAVFGCLLAGYYLLRVYDGATASFTAAGINTLVGVLGLALSAISSPLPARDKPNENEAGPVSLSPSGGSWIYLAIGISGMTALGAEVVWTRLLSLLLGGTVYTFSVILAVFLIGLGLGSALGSELARKGTSARLQFGVCQFLLAGAIAWAAYLLAKSLPFWPVDLSLPSGPWLVFQLDLVRSAFAVLPAAFLWGASFPLALAAAAGGAKDTGKLVGGVYAANTLGAIAGAVGTSVVLIRWLGTQRAQQCLIGVSVLSALLLLVPLLWRSEATADDEREAAAKPRFQASGAVGLLAGLAVAAWLARSVAPLPWQLVAYGRAIMTNRDYDTPLFVGEGMNSSVAVTRMSSGARCFHVSGKVEASSLPQDMRLQRMLGHLPAMLHTHPKSVLIVGCGAGVTAGSFVLYPDVQRIVICELEPLIPKVVAGYFGNENNHMLQDPRVHVVYDDARHYVLTTHEKFDIITSDPIHPWMKGAATLYTKEYFELCKQHLNPGGMVTQWVPLYESTREAVKSEVATFFDVFPNGTVWGNEDEGHGYDSVVLGQVDPLEINVDQLQARLDSPPYRAVRDSLGEVQMGSAFSLLNTYAGRPQELTDWLAGAEINRDRNLRLQFLAGMGLNERLASWIYDGIVSRRRFPAGLMFGTGPDMARLRKALRGKRVLDESDATNSFGLLGPP